MTLTEEEFLRNIVWHDAAPEEFSTAAGRGDVAAVARLLAKAWGGLGARANRNSVRRRRFTAAAVSWSGPAFLPELSGRGKQLFDGWIRAAELSSKLSTDSRASLTRTLRSWLAEVTPDHPVGPLEMLTLCEVLRFASQSLPEDLLLATWRAALDSAVSPEAFRMEASPPELRIVLDGELPWIVGLLFRYVSGTERLREQGREALRKHLDESTDGDGTPRAELLPAFPAWLGSLTRATEWGLAADEALWDSDGQERFSSLVARAVALLTPRQRLALSNPAYGPALPLLSAAAGAARWKKRQPGAALLLPSDLQQESRKSTASRNGSQAKTDEDGPGFQSDWAQTACLRGDWSRKSPILAVSHAESRPIVALSARGREWFSGVWELDLTIDGQQVDTAADWACTCWFTDADVDFVELQAELPGEIRIERQLLLARRDSFALLTDSVSAVDSTIGYRSRLPLTADVTANADATTREIRLHAGKKRIRVFPLALPDDRVASTAGGLTGDDGLDYEVSGVGGVVAPLVLDWKSTRSEAKADWRKLTVTEDGRPVGGEIGSGFRVRVGNYQLLIYRRLTPAAGLRAVLGHHTGHETVIGRFDKAGNVQPLVFVE